MELIVTQTTVFLFTLTYCYVKQKNYVKHLQKKLSGFGFQQISLQNNLLTETNSVDVSPETQDDLSCIVLLQ